MKRFIIIAAFLLTGGGLLLSGCYDDKGSYDYHDVNEVVIDLPSTVSVRLSNTDTVSVQIEPKLSQTLEEGETQLTYLWEKGQKKGLAETEWIPCGEERVCELSFTPEDVNPLTIRLRVQDHREDGSEWYKQLTVQPIVPFQRSWFVLQDIGGKCVLGAVDGEGSSAVVVPDAYKSTMEKDLPVGGTPKYVVTNWTYGPMAWSSQNYQPVIFVGTDQDVYVMDAVLLEQVVPRQASVTLTYREMLHIKTELDDEIFAPEWLASFTYAYMALGEILSDNGKLYMANTDGYSVYYPLDWENEGDASDFKITKLAPLNNIGYILYDEQNHRFLKAGRYYDYERYASNLRFRHYVDEQYFSPDYTWSSLAKIGENPQGVNKFDPDNIGDDKRMISMNMYSAEENDGVLATCFSTSDNKIHVYDLNANGFSEKSDEAICVGEYTFDLPGGMNVDEISVTTSAAFGKTVFFAGGNKIYKVDFNRIIPRTSLLYEYEDPGVKITGLKFRNSYYDTGYSADPNDIFSDFLWNNFPYYLGASLDYGGNKGGIVEMKLTTAAEVDPDSEIVEYKGFGKIVDFEYSAKI